MPPTLALSGVSEDDWTSVMYTIDYVLLNDFADKWSERGLQNVLYKNVFRAAVRDSEESLAAALGPSRPIEMNATVTNRRAEWDRSVVPVLRKLCANINDLAIQHGSDWRAEIVDVEHTPAAAAELATRRARTTIESKKRTSLRENDSQGDDDERRTKARARVAKGCFTVTSNSGCLRDQHESDEPHPDFEKSRRDDEGSVQKWATTSGR